MGEYLNFDKMITPVLIQVIFWLLTALTVIGGLVTVIMGDGAGIKAVGVISIILGPLLIRIWAELALVLFKINENLTEIRQKP